MFKYLRAASFAVLVALFLALPDIQIYLQNTLDAFKNRNLFSSMTTAPLSRRAIKKVLATEQEEVRVSLLWWMQAACMLIMAMGTGIGCWCPRSAFDRHPGLEELDTFLDARSLPCL